MLKMYPLYFLLNQMNLDPLNDFDQILIRGLNMSKTNMFAVAFGIATLSFWVIVIGSPPTSQAASEIDSVRAELATADHCVTFGICP